MKIIAGYDSKKLHYGNRDPVYIDDELTVNGHILIMGMSGSGKTHTLRKIISQMLVQAQDDFRVHIFDVHGDIDVDGSSMVRFSEVSTYGINPFILNTDIHEGGVRKRIQSFINIIRRTSYVLGDKQESALRNLLVDTYTAKGFSMTDPNTWEAVEPVDEVATNDDARLFLDVPYDEKDEAKSLGARWSTEPKGWYIDASNYKGGITKWKLREGSTIHKRVYPTLADLAAATQARVKETYLGVNSDVMIKLAAFHGAAGKFNALQKKMERAMMSSLAEERDAAEKSMEKASAAVVVAVEEYLQCSRSEKEIDDTLKYGNLDVLKSVAEKIENLKATGVFKNKKPEFDTCIQRHHIKALSDDEQKMYTLFSLERMFEDAKRKGVCSYVRDVFIIDEAAKFFSDDEQNILNIMAREARKFGVAMICASQAPTHFSDDFISSVATKIILGIDEMFWDSSARKLRVPLDDMKWVQPKKQMLMQIKQSGAAKNDWRQVGLTD